MCPYTCVCCASYRIVLHGDERVADVVCSCVCVFVCSYVSVCFTAAPESAAPTGDAPEAAASGDAAGEGKMELD